MINKVMTCIFPTKCTKAKPVLMALGFLVLMMNALLVKAVPYGESLAGNLQPITVTGTVTDQDNAPLVGVYVVVEGTQQGTITDANGKYSLAVPGADANLVFSYVGFLSETVAVAGQTVINVSMSPDITSLEEVVVIGYGTQRKEAVTGSVASIKEEVVKEVQASNITNALQGRVSGVEMSQVSTKPGATMQIRVRGTRSIQADNNPLIVLDGIPFGGSLGDIDPSNIKSVDILKDASATAIYGSRGANGVIIVNSIKGTKGKKATINYNGYYGLKKVFAPYPMMEGPEFVELRALRGQYSNGIDEADDVNTDWQDLFYRDGSVNSHDIGISGGTETGSYNFGMGYYNEEAVVPTQGYKRFSMRAALDQQVGKYLSFGLSSNNNYSINTGNQVGLYGVLSMSPIANPYNDDGSLKRIVNLPADQQYVWTKELLEDMDETYVGDLRRFGTFNSIYGEVKIPWIEGLKYRINLGLGLTQNNNGNYTGKGIGATNPETISSGSIDINQSWNWAVENLIIYDRTFAEVHQVNFTGLYSAEQSRYTRTAINGRNIPSDFFQYYNLGTALDEITVNKENRNYTQRGLLSYMARLMYSYDNRYMLSVAMRSDGSSVLAEGHKWHTYPAVSAGWNIGNEAFMESIIPITSLKLRVGFGQTSNQSVNPYQTAGELGTRDYNFGSQYATGYLVTLLSNDQLGWEFSKTWNYGIDFGLFDDRLSGSIEYYITNTEDVLLYQTLPATNGVTRVLSNIGAMENKGFEITLNGVIIKNLSGFSWEAGFNLYSNKNEITQLASGETRNESDWLFVGHPLNNIFDYEKIGLWQEGDPYLTNLEGAAGMPGMIKVRYTGDYNEDGTPVRMIGAADRQIMDADPKFQGGFNTRFAYKGLDLSVVGAFRHGGILISSLYSASGYLNLLTGRRGNVDVDYWTPENTDADFPNPAGPISGDNPKYGSTLGYFDAGYLKIRNITLGYTLPNNLVGKVGVTKLRVYATVQNPFVFFSPYKDISGMDPEANSYGDENAATTGAYPRRLLTIGTNTPSTRNYLIGLNLTF